METFFNKNLSQNAYHVILSPDCRDEESAVAGSNSSIIASVAPLPQHDKAIFEMVTKFFRPFHQAEDELLPEAQHQLSSCTSPVKEETLAPRVPGIIPQARSFVGGPTVDLGRPAVDPLPEQI